MRSRPEGSRSRANCPSGGWVERSGTVKLTFASVVVAGLTPVSRPVASRSASARISGSNSPLTSVLTPASLREVSLSAAYKP